MAIEIKPSPKLVEYVRSLEAQDLPENLMKLKDHSSGTILNSDLKWLGSHLKSPPGVYLHELLEGSELILPTLPPPPERNPELVARLERLKAEQEQREYNRMTSNVTKRHNNAPAQLNIGHELKQINAQMLEVFQFVLSLVAAFAFGFLGVDWLIGPFEFGTRALIGISVTIVVAVAELYFLVRIIGESDASLDVKKLQ